MRDQARGGARATKRRPSMVIAGTVGAFALLLGGGSGAAAVGAAGPGDLVEVTTQPASVTFDNVAPGDTRSFLINIAVTRTAPVELLVEVMAQGPAPLFPGPAGQGSLGSVQLALCSGAWSPADPAEPGEVEYSCSGATSPAGQAPELRPGQPATIVLPQANPGSSMSLRASIHFSRQWANAAQDSSGALTMSIAAREAQPTPLPTPTGSATTTPPPGPPPTQASGGDVTPGAASGTPGGPPDGLGGTGFAGWAPQWLALLGVGAALAILARRLRRAPHEGSG